MFQGQVFWLQAKQGSKCCGWRKQSTAEIWLFLLHVLLPRISTCCFQTRSNHHLHILHAFYSLNAFLTLWFTVDFEEFLCCTWVGRSHLDRTRTGTSGRLCRKTKMQRDHMVEKWWEMWRICDHRSHSVHFKTLLHTQIASELWMQVEAPRNGIIQEIVQKPQDWDVMYPWPIASPQQRGTR